MALLLIFQTHTSCFWMLLIEPGGEPIDDNPSSSYEPVYMSREQLNGSVKIKPAQELRNTGKIYIFGNYIFVNQRYKGIHIINNSNPSSPINEKFIEIPGCLDMAVKQNTLYADNAVDLLTLDISNLQNIQLVNRLQNTFPSILSPNGIGWDYADPSKGIVVDWIEKK